MPIGFEVILPTEPLINVPEFERDLRASIDPVIGYAQGLFSKTTTTWSKRPVFDRVMAQISGGTLNAGVATDDEIYFYVCRGTRPHTIRPRNRGGRLAVPSVHRAKTSPRKLTSYPGTRSGPIMRPKVVRHPGSKARDFDVEIAERTQPRLDKAVQAVIEKYARLSRKETHR
jgi:hypothetical protein